MFRPSFLRRRNFNPHRQLTEEETRIYAAGMNAARNGQIKQAPDTIAKDLLKIWYMGYNRIGKAPSQAIPRRMIRSVDRSHMVYTELTTFNEAINLIEMQQRSAKAHAAMGPWKPTVEKLLKLDTMRHLSSRYRKQVKISLAGNGARDEQPAIIDERLAASERLIERIKRAVDAIMFGIEEMNSFPDGQSALKCKLKYLIDIITKLCDAAGIAKPVLSSGMTAGMKATPKLCINCGSEFIGHGPTCDECLDNSEAHYNSIQRRNREERTKELERDAREIARILDEIKKART